MRLNIPKYLKQYVKLLLMEVVNFIGIRNNIKKIKFSPLMLVILFNNYINTLLQSNQKSN